MRVRFLVTIAAALLMLIRSSPGAGLPPVHIEGTRFVDGTGRPVILRGCNLGNWLVLEMWMTNWSGAGDQWEVEQVLSQRFGQEQKDRWLDEYRGAFIQDRDFELLKSFGFNCVRVPFHYANVLEAESPYAIRADAFRWLDRALELCEKHNVYAILDLHAAPGAQSVDHNAGRSDQNRLWSDEQCQDAMVRLWAAVAKRYAGRSVVAGYDILNEPYGNHREDLAAPMLSLARRCYPAIREHDPDHIVLLPAVLGAGLRMYDTDDVRGWKQVGLTQHEYPGIFGAPGGLKNMMHFLHRQLADDQQFVQHMNRPMYIGEFNGATHANGGVYLTRMQYDRYAQFGWAATMWSYKILKPEGGTGVDGWYAVTNAQPMTRINVRTSTREQIEQHLAEIRNVPLAPHKRLQELLTSSSPVDLAVEVPPELPTEIPPEAKPPWWVGTNIGDGAGSSFLANQRITVVARGSDIFNNSDNCYFASRPTAGDFNFSTTPIELLESGRYAKAGIMLRQGTSPDAAFAFMHVFPDGTLAFCWRATAGEKARERKFHFGDLPLGIRLQRKGDAVRGSYLADGQWELAGEVSLPQTAGDQVGFAVSSNSDRNLTRAAFVQTVFSKEEQ